MEMLDRTIKITQCKLLNGHHSIRQSCLETRMYFKYIKMKKLDFISIYQFPNSIKIDLTGPSVCTVHINWLEIFCCLLLLLEWDNFFRSTTNLKCHTNESYQNAFGHINSICYTESSKLRDTRLDFFSLGK